MNQFKSFNTFKEEYMFKDLPTGLSEYAKFIQNNLGSYGIIKEELINEALHENEVFVIIHKAIRKMQYISMYYNDSDGEEGFRLVEPFVIGKGFRRKGIVSKDLKDVYYLRGYVVRESDKDVFVDQKIKNIGIKSIGSKISSSSSTDWRLFRLDKISKVEILDINFEFERPFYNPNDKSFVEIINAVSKSRLKNPETYNMSATQADINFTYYYKEKDK